MQTKKRTGSSALYYVLAFQVIIVLLILFLGIYVTKTTYSKMEEEFYASNQVALDSIMENHANELQIFSDIATQINLSDNTRFVLEKQPDKSARLKEELYRYRSVNQFFDVMYYHYLKDEYLFNHSTSIRVTYFCEKGYLFSECSQEELQEMLMDFGRQMRILPEQTLSGEISHFYNEQAQSVLYLLPIPPKYDGVLLFFVGASHYDKLLGQREESNVFLIYDGQVIAQRGEETIETEELLELLSADSANGQITASFGKDRYMLTVAQDAFGFTYVSAQNVNIFYRDLREHFISVFILLLLCCVPTVIATVVISRSMLQRIRSIGKLIVSDKKTDAYRLDMMESGIHELLDASENLKEDQLLWKKNHFIRNFIRGDYTAMEILRMDARAAGISLDLEIYMIGIIGFHGNGENRKVMDRIDAYIEKEQNLEGYGMALANTSQYAMMLFSDTEERLYAAYEKILTLGKEQCGDFTVAVSWHHRSLMIGSQAFLEANAAYDSRFLMDNSQVIRFNAIGQDESISNFSELRNILIPKLEGVIRVGNQQEVENAIAQICKQLEENHASLLTFRLMYDEILHILMNQWKGTEKDWNEIYNVFTLSQCLSIQDFTSLLTDACHMLLESGASAENKQSQLAKEAIRLMQERFFDAELTMSTLSEELGISSVTLAVEFKNATGISPSDYLAAIRMDQAKEYLKNTDMLIREIAIKVGYEDDHVFIRRFKKYTGKTPGQYRKENTPE